MGFKIRAIYINESHSEILSTCLFLPLAMKAAFLLLLLVLRRTNSTIGRMTFLAFVFQMENLSSNVDKMSETFKLTVKLTVVFCL